jgi:Cytochrome b5-like Heme/Steroid binding domain
MDGLLLLAFTSLLLISIVYVCVRRGRHGGLAGGDSTVLTPPGVAEPGMGRILTLQDVAEHNMPTDLWLIINRKVYDFTEVRY